MPPMPISALPSHRHPLRKHLPLLAEQKPTLSLYWTALNALLCTPLSLRAIPKLKTGLGLAWTCHGKTPTSERCKCPHMQSFHSFQRKLPLRQVQVISSSGRQTPNGKKKRAQLSCKQGGIYGCRNASASWKFHYGETVPSNRGGRPFNVGYTPISVR